MDRCLELPSCERNSLVQVWHALNSDGASVAVKILNEATAQQKAKDEAAALSAFDHAHLLRLHLLIEDSLHQQIYLVTDFAAGGDLLKLMNERECKPMPEDEIRRYFRQLLFALDHMHRRGWVHRDIKCENVLLSANREHMVLADFGFATQWTPTQVITGTCLRTTAYTTDPSPQSTSVRCTTLRQRSVSVSLTTARRWMCGA